MTSRNIYKYTKQLIKRMIANDLMELDLTKNEATVFSALLKEKTAPAGTIIKITNLHRNLVYENLEQLIEKGLITYIIENNKKIFQAENSSAIIDMIKKKRKEYEKKQQKAEKLKKEIDKLHNTISNKQEAAIFRGVKGIQTVMNITLEQNKNYAVLGSPKQAIELMPPAYWENYNKKIQQENITVRMIFNEELRKWSAKIQHPLNKIKFLPHQFDSLTETNICEDRVSIFIWTNPPLAISIKDKELSKGYMQHFEYLWKISKK